MNFMIHSVNRNRYQIEAELGTRSLNGIRLKGEIENYRTKFCFDERGIRCGTIVEYFAMSALLPHKSNYSYYHCVGGNDYYEESSKRSCVFYNLCHFGSEPDVLYYYVDPNQPKFPVMADNNAYIYDWTGQELQLGVYSRFSFNWSPKTKYEAMPSFPYDTAERAYFFHSFGEPNPGHFMDLPHSMFVQSLLHGYEHSKDTRLLDHSKNVPNAKNREQLLSTISSPKPMFLREMGDVCFKTVFAGAGSLAALEGNHLHALTAEKFRDAVIRGFGFDPSTYPPITKHKIVVIQKNPISSNLFNRFVDHDKMVEFLVHNFEGIADVVNMLPDHFTWRQQVEMLQTATVVLTTAGGGSYLATFAREGATIVISDRNFKGPSRRDPATVGKDDNWWTQFHSITSMHYTVCNELECDDDIIVALPRMFLTLIMAMTAAEKFPISDGIPNHLRVQTLWRHAAERGAPLPSMDMCSLTWDTKEILPDLRAELKLMTEKMGKSTKDSEPTVDFEDKKAQASHKKGSHQQSANCSSNVNATLPYSSEFVDRLSLWKEVASDFDARFGESLYGSQEALEAIYRHQNPEDCSKAHYLVSGGWSYGFASRIHQEGAMLALAMQLGRVYLPHPDGDNIYWETAVPFCRKGGGTDRLYDDASLQCFYAAASRCTIHDAAMGMGGDVNKLPKRKVIDFSIVFNGDNSRQRFMNILSDTRAILIESSHAGTQGTSDAPFHAATIPFQLRGIVECSPMKPDAYPYWWRAVSTAFLMRPNAYTVKALNAFRAQVSIPDYKKCVAFYVPHSSGESGEGAVGVEKAIKFDTYKEAVERVRSMGLIPGVSNKISTSGDSLGEGSKGVVFLGTEDPQVVEQADTWSHTSGWDLHYTNLVDRAAPRGSAGSSRNHDPQEYLSLLLNLEIALKCEAWVCTLSSSFCRIIDELRCTVGAKCNRFYADISNQTCSAPPCIEESSHVYLFEESRRNRIKRK